MRVDVMDIRDEENGKLRADILAFKAEISRLRREEIQWLQSNRAKRDKLAGTECEQQ